MGQSLKWAAQLDNVSEVSLTGTADFDYWKNHLATQGYVPVKTDDRASIAVVSASGKFAGVRFQELSISVSVSAPNGGMGLPSFFLVQAFSSNRFFAFCERALFSTPYQFANVTVDYPEPTGVRVFQKGQVCLESSMASNAAAHQRSRVERRDLWLAQILLPFNPQSASLRRRMFFARICGNTQIYPFLHGIDRIKIPEHSGCGAIDSLLKSNFAPVEWLIRPKASHAKSKTYTIEKSTELEASVRDELVRTQTLMGG
ncbi:MAG: hypothetical protein JNL58_00720 [Planctomyces sp.]|nr:hypothetical protein [Planctomyces sp.]